MDSNIVSNEAARLAYQIAGYSHRPVDEIVLTALRDFANRTLPSQTKVLPTEPSDFDRPLYDKLMAIAESYAALPIYDHRTPEEIIGYDEHGLPPQ